MKDRTIAWQSWNAIHEEKNEKKQEENNVPEDENSSLVHLLNSSDAEITVYSPWGMVLANHPLKPTDRWDCWIAHLDFRLTKNDLAILTKVDGVASIIVMDPYSFCIGISKRFEFTNVKREIERKVCDRLKRNTDA